MKKFNKVQRIAVAILLVTDAVTSEDLEPLGIKKSQADSWAKNLLDKQTSFQDDMVIFQNGDTDVSINHLLVLCIDQRYFTKKLKKARRFQVNKKAGVTCFIMNHQLNISIIFCNFFCNTSLY